MKSRFFLAALAALAVAPLAQAEVSMPEENIPNFSFEIGSAIKGDGTKGVIDGIDTYTANWTFGGTVYLGKSNSGVIRNGWPIGTYSIAFASGASAATNTFSLSKGGLYAFSFRRSMISDTAMLTVKIDGEPIDVSTINANYQVVNTASPLTTLEPVYIPVGDHTISLEASSVPGNQYLMVDDLHLDRIACGVGEVDGGDANMEGGVAAQVTSSETIRAFTLTETNYTLTVKATPMSRCLLWVAAVAVAASAAMAVARARLSTRRTKFSRPAHT